MSLRKKVKRSLGKRNHKDRENQVDKINEEAMIDALKSEAQSVDILHPTKGYTRFSLHRLQYIGGTASMWARIKAGKQKTREIQEEVEVNGQAE